MKSLDEIRTELAYCTNCGNYNLSINRLFSHIQERDEVIQKLKSALEFYADEKTWSHDKFLCGSDAMRSDLSETVHSRFTPGTKARSALAEIIYSL